MTETNISTLGSIEDRRAKGRILYNCREQRRCYISAFCADWSPVTGWFPRGIMPSEMGNVIEIEGALLLIEWKPDQKSVTTGQRKFLRKATTPLYRGAAPVDRRNYSMLIVGEPKTLQPRYIEVYKMGSTYECWPTATRETLELLIRSWVEFAEGRIEDWPSSELCREGKTWEK